MVKALLGRVGAGSTSFESIRTLRRKGPPRALFISAGLLAGSVLLAPSLHAQTSADRPTPVVPGIGDPRSLGQGASVGAFVDIFRTAIAPGRRAIEPKLWLVYNSFGGPTDLGMGWQLDVGRIERSTKHGVPQPGDDSFQFSVNGIGGELVNVGSGAYRAKFESAFRQFRFSSGTWEMLDNQGIRYRFGTTAESRVENASWMLDSITDPNGNTVVLTYERDHDKLYPQAIRYTGNINTGDPGANEVTFEYEDRTDDVRSTYMLGLRQEMRRRLHSMTSRTSGQLARQYVLQYASGGVTSRSLLSDIIVTGNSSTPSITARHYDYQNPQVGWPTVIDGSGLPIDFNGSDGKDLGIRQVDVNGDGFVDLVQNGQAVFLGNGSGQFTQDAVWTASIAATGVTFVNGDGFNTGGDMIDADGDLRPDLIQATRGGEIRQVFRNTGRGFVLDAAYTASLQALHETVTAERRFFPPFTDACADGGTLDAGADASCSDLISTDIPFSLLAPASANGSTTPTDPGGVSFGDVNGDGLTDILWSFRSTEGFFGFGLDGGTLERVPSDIRAVYLNTGTGWTRSASLSDALRTTPGLEPFVSDSQVQGYATLDVNGDGLADLIRTLDGQPQQAFLNNSAGWTLDSDYTTSLQDNGIISLMTDRKSAGLLTLDYNGDGLIDYVRADSGVTQAYRNTGLGFATDDAMTAQLNAIGLKVVDSDRLPLGVAAVDLNGDTSADLLIARAGIDRAMRTAYTALPDVVSHSITALGEQVDVSYLPSTRFDNSGGDDIQDLPLIFHLARQMTRNDGRGHPRTTTYNYEGGLFTDRQYRGFAIGESVDTRGVLNRSHFRQTEALAGTASLVEIFDASNAVRARKTTTYVTPSPATGVTQVAVSETTDETIDAGGSVLVRTRISYDEFLNTVETHRDGDVANPNDDTRTVMEWAINSSAGLTSFPFRITVFDADDNVFSQSTIHYDGLGDGQVSRGNPTAITDRLDDNGGSVTRTATFDQFGNMVASSDRNGNVSRFAYDSVQNSYRISAQDPEGNTVRSTFDPRFGTPTSNIDAAGNTSTREYDIFGRLARVTEPGDESSSNGTRTYAYSPLVGDANNQFASVSATVDPASSERFTTTAFFDGLAQAFRTVTDGAGGRNVIVLTEFDDIGNVASTSAPFFDGDTPYFSATERDTLRRPTRITETDGLSQTLTYAGLRTDVVDRRGSRSAFVRNFTGQNVEVHEFVSSAEQVTRYQYDPSGRPTQVVDALGETTTIRYDQLGRRLSIVDPAGGAFSYAHDGVGNIVDQTAPDGRHTAFQYDRNGLLRLKVLPDGKTVAFTYGTSSAGNGAGRLVRVTDPNTVFELDYDTRGRIAEKRKTIDGQTYVLDFQYDSMGRMRHVDYPDDFALDYHYDQGGYPDRVTDNLGRDVASLTHTAIGRVSQLNFANGVVSNYQYDPRLQLQRVNTLDPHGAALQDLSYGYDAVANVTSVVDNANSLKSQSFAYDELNRVTRATGAYGLEIYEYDPIGTLLRKGNVVFLRDPVKRQQVKCGIDLALATEKKNGIASDDALLACADALVDASSGLTPDEQATVALIRSRAGNNKNLTGASVTLSYDAKGNIVRKNDTLLDYDDENRLLLVSEAHQGNAKSSEPKKTIEQNIYDPAGMRIRRLAGDHGNGSEQSNAASSHDVSSVYVDDVFEVNGPNVLRHVMVGTMIVATNVVPLSHVKMHPPHPASSALALFVLRNLRPALPAVEALALVLALGFVGWSAPRIRWRQLAAKTLETFVRGTQPVRRRPLRAGIALAIAGLQFVQGGCGGRDSRSEGLGVVMSDLAAKPNPDSAEQIFYYHLDHVGNTNVVTDAAGVEVTRHDYRPFGEQLSPDLTKLPASSPLAQERDLVSSSLDVSFNGQHFDQSTGFYYFGARHYDPTLGRFLSTDSEVRDPNQPQALNRYSFNANNPLRYVDPTGHSVLDFFTNAIVDIVLALVIIAAVLVVGALTGGVGAILFAVIIGTVAGLVIGGVIGAIVAANAGLDPGSGEFWKVVAGFAIAGAFVGAATGASIGLFSGAGVAAATSGARLATLALIAAATGSVGGGTAAFFVNKEKYPGSNGFTDDFAMDFMLGGAAGAASVLAPAAVGAFAVAGFATTAGFLALAAAYVVVGIFASYGYYCQSTGKCGARNAAQQSPTDLVSGQLAASGGNTSPLTPGDPITPVAGVPDWVFTGTMLQRMQAHDDSRLIIRRDPFETFPLAP
jgi:RHS repeat-associated protein